MLSAVESEYPEFTPDAVNSAIQLAQDQRFTLLALQHAVIFSTPAQSHKLPQIPVEQARTGLAS